MWKSRPDSSWISYPQPYIWPHQYSSPSLQSQTATLASLCGSSTSSQTHIFDLYISRKKISGLNWCYLYYSYTSWQGKYLPTLHYSTTVHCYNTIYCVNIAAVWSPYLLNCAPLLIPIRGGSRGGSRGSSEPPLAGGSLCTTTPSVDKHQN